MKMIPWKPFGAFDDLLSDDEWLTPVFSKMDAVRPAIDIFEKDGQIVAEVNVPDFDPEKITVEVENGMLRIRGSMDTSKEEKEKGYWRKEIRKGSFERQVSLPAEVDEDSVRAEYEKGILRVTMPKVAARAATKKKIEITEKK